MAAYNITADPEYGDFLSLAPDSLRRKRIDELADKIYANMTPAQLAKRGQQRSSPDTTVGRGDEARKVALKQAIAQEQKENAAAPNFTALDRGVGARDTTLEPGISLPPEPTIESETVKPTATGLTSDQLTQRILDQDAALAEEEASRPPLPAADAAASMTTPMPPVAKPAAQAMPDTGTAPADEPFKSLLERVAPSLYRSADEDTSGTTFPTVGTPTGKTNAELRQDILDQEAALQEEIANNPPISTPTGQTNAELRENILRQDMALHGEEIDARNRSQRPDIGGLPEGAVKVPDLPEKRGLLSRLGGFAKDNPELLAQVAQAGGGLMQDIAQGRAQKAADAKTRGAMAQSNLIGALTGGKSRPAVMREEAEQGGLLARLGQAVEAGGRVAGGEMKRRTALSQRDEEMGLKGRKVAADELNAESQKAYREAMADMAEKQLGVEDRKTAARLTSDYLKAAENQRKESRLPVKQITELASQFSTLNKLDSLEDFIVGADFSALEMGPLSLDEPSQFIFGTDPRVAQGKIQGLIMEIAQSVPGVLTEQDQKRLEQILFTMNDRPSTALDIADAFRQAKIEGLTTQLGGLKEAGGYDVSYFERQIQDYGKDKGEEGLIKLLQGTKLELE